MLDRGAAPGAAPAFDKPKLPLLPAFRVGPVDLQRHACSLPGLVRDSDGGDHGTDNAEGHLGRERVSRPRHSI